MMLIEETSVPSEALPVADFKSHLRLGTGFSDDAAQDDLLESFLRAAMTAIEARTGKILLQRVFSWTINRWSNPVTQGLPVAPISAIVRLVLRDPRNDEEIVAPEFYNLQPDSQRPILRARGSVLPIIAPGGTAELVFQAGYGADWSKLPSDLSQAVMLLATHYYEHRDETSLAAGCMPFGVSSLIERYRTVRVFIGGAQT